MNSMGIGKALQALQNGERVTRDSWHDEDVWLVLVPGSRITVETGRPLGDAAPELVGTTVSYQPHIDIRTADGQVAPWTATQADLLAEDWRVL